MINLHEYVAILIDADNAQLSHIEQVLKLSEYYGQLEICRAYGDWKGPQLSSSCEKIDDLKIDRRQVNRVGKNATDHRLLMEAGEILGDHFFGNEVSIFVIVSGDGDFASACELIKERGKQVIGIGNSEQTSSDLRSACEAFYYLEDLDHMLGELEKLHPIPPKEVRAFYDYLFFAYHRLTDNDDWISYSQLGEKLHEIAPDYKSRFGKYSLSEWLRNYVKDFESHEQMIRRIDPNPEITREQLLLKAYLQTRQSDGMAHQAQLGKALRGLARDYESQFGGKKLSEWIEAYPDTFKIRGNFVVHRNNW